MSDAEARQGNQDAPDPYYSHWADIAARRTISAHPDAKQFTCAAGITPSGVVHIGNFREVITVELVARALADAGVEVRFIYSWDDFDVFRKVPVDMPQQQMLQDNLRRSIADVPDPHGEHDSYASHNIAALERSLEPMHIAPEFIRQSKRYRAGTYAEGIRKALAGRDEIARILNQHRKTPLREDWLPLAGFCDECGRDELDLRWNGEWTVHVECRSCGARYDQDLREGGNLKLPWRVDWPMRWAHEQVRFEPGGKDHSSAGGSYDTAREIVAAVYDWTAPEYVAYDFVRIKGSGGKISSSKGGVITVDDALEVYEPELLRWIFASYRPNTEFQISFDLDVIKIYEDYDKAVRLAHQPDDGGRNDKKRQVARRTLQLASLDNTKIEPGSPVPRVPSFRPLSMTLQIYDGDLERAQAYYEKLGEIETDDERARFRTRARCTWNWIEMYAPDDFRYRIRTEPVRRELGDDVKLVLGRLIETMRAHPELSEDELAEVTKTMTEGTELDRKTLFPIVYDLLIDRPKGPKLTTLLVTMGFDRALPLLERSL